MKGRGLWRQPALHFLVLGALLFAGDAVLSETPQEPAQAGEPAADRTRRLREAWTARTGAPPSAEILEGLVRAELDDELWIAEARRLGMDRRDPVVRRRLAQILKLGVSAAARAEEPAEAELEAYLAANRARFRQPARVRLAHVYLSRDRRGGRARADAASLRDELARQGLGPEAVERFGDPFLIPGTLPPRSERELARDFGPDFARAVAELEPGAWSQPVASAYGFHLVWVLGRSEARDPSLDEVRSAVRESVLAERAEQAIARAQEELRTRPR